MSGIKYDENGKCTCLRCGWKWRPRVDIPVACPNPHCQSRDWNVPLEEKEPEAIPVEVPTETVHARVIENVS